MTAPVPPWRYRFVAWPENIGLLRLLAVTAVVYALMVWLLLALVFPAGSTSAVRGRIVGLGFRETDTGSYPTANVEVEGSTVRIDLPARLDCGIGDLIDLNRRKLRAGYAYGPASPRPCSDQPPFRN